MEMCLLCLDLCNNGSEERIPVDSKKWQEENIGEIIEKHLWIMKTMNPTAWLCMECWTNISDFHKFYTRIENAHANFTSMFKTELQDINENIDNEIHNLLEVSDILEGSLDQKPLCRNIPHDEEVKISIVKNENIEQIIEEPVETLLFRRSRRRIKEDPLKKSSATTEKYVQRNLKRIGKNCKLNKQEVKDKTKGVNDKGKKLTTSLNKDENLSDTYNEETNEANQSDGSYDNLTENSSDKEEKSSRPKLYYKPSSKYRDLDEFVAQNFKINCGICQFPMKTFQDVYKHSALEHKRRGFVMCCNKKFFRRSILVEHLRWHLDPEYFKCPDCGKVMADRRCLDFHARVHEKLERIHICDECGKAFTRPLALKRHKLIHLPDEEKKYSCDQCGKNFAGNNLLSNHVRSVHLNKYSIVCELCGRRMRSKEVFERHMLQHEGRPLPTVACDICGLKMTDPRGLKRHKEIQHPEGGRTEFKCSLCPKISPTLKAHKKHVQYKHILGYNFKCTVCEKAFKRAISLTEHMATHTGTVLYTCPYCPKTFNSNANMHNHRKKSHPKEWEEACRARYSGNLPPSYKPPNV